MADEEQTSPSDYGYDDRYEYLHICPTCYELYETGRPDGEEQRCRYQPGEETAWPYHDFNEHGSGGLWHWYAIVMPRNLKHFGLEGDVSLREYMEITTLHPDAPPRPAIAPYTFPTPAGGVRPSRVAGRCG